LLGNCFATDTERAAALETIRFSIKLPDLLGNYQGGRMGNIKMI
jgi:hypothetical protein